MEEAPEGGYTARALGESIFAEADSPDRGRSERYSMTITDRIEINPKIMFGKPVIRGTRVTIELILRKLGEGTTEAELLDAYPQLKKEDIQAAIAYNTSLSPD